MHIFRKLSAAVRLSKNSKITIIGATSKNLCVGGGGGGGVSLKIVSMHGPLLKLLLLLRLWKKLLLIWCGGGGAGVISSVEFNAKNNLFILCLLKICPALRLGVPATIFILTPPHSLSCSSYENVFCNF